MKARKTSVPKSFHLRSCKSTEEILKFVSKSSRPFHKMSFCAHSHGLTQSHSHALTRTSFPHLLTRSRSIPASGSLYLSAFNIQRRTIITASLNEKPCAFVHFVHYERHICEGRGPNLNDMALTKSQLIETLAEKTSVEKKTAEAMLDCLAQLAYEHAKDEFSIPGIGKLILVDRKARTARNPQTGAEIQVPAKKALKFRVAKAAKDAILAASAPTTTSPSE
ncbi:MAG: hup [Verrucomicrobiales bacterium]|nr:hup [Verrucomicrobiales bacterium]